MQRVTSSDEKPSYFNIITLKCVLGAATRTFLSKEYFKVIYKKIYRNIYFFKGLPQIYVNWTNVNKDIETPGRACVPLSAKGKRYFVTIKIIKDRYGCLLLFVITTRVRQGLFFLCIALKMFVRNNCIHYVTSAPYQTKRRLVLIIAIQSTIIRFNSGGEDSREKTEYKYDGENEATCGDEGVQPKAERLAQPSAILQEVVAQAPLESVLTPAQLPTATVVAL